jgi:hypothetical protein
MSAFLPSDVFAYVKTDASSGSQWGLCEDGTRPSADETSCESCKAGRAGRNGLCHECEEEHIPNLQRTECTKPAARPVWKEEWFWGAMSVVLMVVFAVSKTVSHTCDRRHKTESENGEAEAPAAAGTAAVATKPQPRKIVL